MPGVVSLVRVVAGSRVLRSLGCIAYSTRRGSHGPLSLPAQSPCSALANRTVGGSAQSACCMAEPVHGERNGLPFTGCCSRRAQAACASRPTPMPMVGSRCLPTRPDANLDCVLAAARVCAAAESPEDLHHPSLGTAQSLHLARTRLWLLALLRPHLYRIASS